MKEGRGKPHADPLATFSNDVSLNFRFYNEVRVLCCKQEWRGWGWVGGGMRCRWALKEMGVLRLEAGGGVCGYCNLYVVSTSHRSSQLSPRMFTTIF